ncbi:glycosyltransferase family 4 protein [Ichthyenterobacterium magnum]|uniref:GalNAc-alpha-(1->4)-GalNAc-alpha-(1->3)-diNAcBac-PP-undecaprenol alpha-1,4-N-acetyl-D-galactosaminyltransferase n=1 Tax=Ichthyenterobacterium magnum TaxID=1230530 RepID=A0A420DLZ5_9FLAO|nr:glycosyltransferase family 4 protein [Ichthyenterobacterium magnum]RKE95314.1 GalNAc-alpha-(1->4)-GalNAc-alpha-(1->3)-diNAcBac-PP-undecaprenol alpha-1,4-N-acetyl-D-galactosaminyltransferase [Ichthyenterobacterium magnum]
MKKKIAFVIPGLESGGAERVVSTLANELCNKYEIIIITLWDVEPFYHLNNAIKHIKCAEKPLISVNIFQALWNNFLLLKKIKKIISNYEIELTIGFTTTANILATLASKSKKIPCIISERSNPNIYTLNKLWNYLRKKTYKRADFLVVQTKQNQSYFNKFTTNKKLIVLPNPLSKELTRNKKRNPNKDNIILNVGRLDKNKSQDLLIRAFSNIKTDGWRLIFVGDGEEKSNYINLTKSLGIESMVSFVGNDTKVYNYYNSSKIFAFTSQSEGFPNVLTEAMYFQLPCISTNCPNGPSEIINDGINGYLIPINDQFLLEQKLTDLMHSENLCKKFGENAFLSVKKYQTENVVRKWDELILKLI